MNHNEYEGSIIMNRKDESYWIPMILMMISEKEVLLWKQKKIIIINTKDESNRNPYEYKRTIILNIIEPAYE